MKKWNVILGVDVSKLTLDIGCSERRLHIKIDNNSKGFGEFKKWCKTNGIDLQETLVVMEYTGGYEYRFIQYCDSKAIPYCHWIRTFYPLNSCCLSVKGSSGKRRGCKAL